MKTKLEIIEETVNYYSEDTSRRAFNGDGCEYLTDDGRSCAVGRCLNNEGLEAFGEAGTYVRVDMLPYLKEEYKVDDIYFWTDLQVLHDDCTNWDDRGLTESGEERIKELKERYA